MDEIEEEFPAEVVCKSTDSGNNAVSLNETATNCIDKMDYENESYSEEAKYDLETDLEDYDFEYPRSTLYNKDIFETLLGLLANVPCDESTQERCTRTCQFVLVKILNKANLSTEDKKDLIKVLLQLAVEVFDTLDNPL